MPRETAKRVGANAGIAPEALGSTYITSLILSPVALNTEAVTAPLGKQQAWPFDQYDIPLRKQRLFAFFIQLHTIPWYAQTKPYLTISLLLYLEWFVNI